MTLIGSEFVSGKIFIRSDTIPKLYYINFAQERCKAIQKYIANGKESEILTLSNPLRVSCQGNVILYVF